MSIPSSRTINYDAMLSSVLDNYKDKMQDVIFSSSVLLSAIKKHGGYETREGGEKISVPLMYGKTPVQSYSGYDVLDTTPVDGITRAFYEWRQLATPIAISRIEERKNTGEAQLFNLLKEKIQQAEMSIAEEVNYQLLGKSVESGAFVSGNGGDDLDPIPLLVPKNPSTSTSIGNINQSTYSWWRNKSVDGSTNGATSQDSGTVKGYDLNTWAELHMALRHLYNQCSRGSGGTPKMVITDQDGYETFEASLADKVRYTQQTDGSLAFDNILFKKGCPMYWDEMVPDLENGVNYESASHATSTYFMLNTQFLKFIVDAQTNFINTPFTKPENQDAKVAHILLYGNLCCTNRRKQGVLYGVSQSITS